MNRERNLNGLSWSSGKRRDLKQESEKLLGLLTAKLGSQIVAAEVSGDHAVVLVDRRNLVDFFRLLKLDSELYLDYLVDITAVDWLDSKELRFEVVYHLMSLQFGYRLRVKVPVPEEEPEVESLVTLYSAANFLEREVWDMLGIRFKGHPDLRRILMYPEFQGHPLRKDYPLQGKQPRVKLRSPEVQNTAPDMLRPDLVQINRAGRGLSKGEARR
jgi:NADH-quinone oxidoreductase subunit C